MIKGFVKDHLKSIFVGVLGSFALFSFYFLILFLVTGDLRHPIEQFLLNRYWTGALILGFGLQIGLFSELRFHRCHPDSKIKATAGIGAGVSTGAMIACCAHHLSDILPILGFSAASVFLTKYQTQFLALGVITNLAGILLMLKMILKKQTIMV